MQRFRVSILLRIAIKAVPLSSMGIFTLTGRAIAHKKTGPSLLRNGSATIINKIGTTNFFKTGNTDFENLSKSGGPFLLLHYLFRMLRPIISKRK